MSGTVVAPLTREELGELVAAAVSATLDARRTVDECTHREHHEFVQMLIARQQRREELWQHVRKHVIGWAVVAFLTGIGSLGWQIFRLATRGLERGG